MVWRRKKRKGQKESFEGDDDEDAGRLVPFSVFLSCLPHSHSRRLGLAPRGSESRSALLRLERASEREREKRESEGDSTRVERKVMLASFFFFFFFFFRSFSLLKRRRKSNAPTPKPQFVAGRVGDAGDGDGGAAPTPPPRCLQCLCAPSSCLLVDPEEQQRCFAVFFFFDPVDGMRLVVAAGSPSFSSRVRRRLRFLFF